jgi:hypothetical protein
MAKTPSEERDSSNSRGSESGPGEEQYSSCTTGAVCARLSLKVEVETTSNTRTKPDAKPVAMMLAVG